MAPFFLGFLSLSISHFKVLLVVCLLFSCFVCNSDGRKHGRKKSSAEFSMKLATETLTGVVIEENVGDVEYCDSRTGCDACTQYVESSDAAGLLGGLFTTTSIRRCWFNFETSKCASYSVAMSQWTSRDPENTHAVGKILLPLIARDSGGISDKFTHNVVNFNSGVRFNSDYYNLQQEFSVKTYEKKAAEFVEVYKLLRDTTFALRTSDVEGSSNVLCTQADSIHNYMTTFKQDIDTKLSLLGEKVNRVFQARLQETKTAIRKQEISKCLLHVRDEYNSLRKPPVIMTDKSLQEFGILISKYLCALKGGIDNDIESPACSNIEQNLPKDFGNHFKHDLVDLAGQIANIPEQVGFRLQEYSDLQKMLLEVDTQSNEELNLLERQVFCQMQSSGSFFKEANYMQIFPHTCTPEHTGDPTSHKKEFGCWSQRYRDLQEGGAFSKKDGFFDGPPVPLTTGAAGLFDE